MCLPLPFPPLARAPQSQSLNNSAAVIYMVDMSDSFQLGSSAAHFHHICSLPTVKGKPILLVLNKMDSPVSVCFFILLGSLSFFLCTPPFRQRGVFATKHVSLVRSADVVMAHLPSSLSRPNVPFPQCLLQRGEVEVMFEMDRVAEELGDSLTVLEASALSGLHIKSMMDWTKGVYGLVV